MPIQSARQVAIATPLGEDVLLFHRMTAAEELGRLFHFELDLLSKDPNINFEDLLGNKVTVRLELADNKTRYFNGFVTRFSMTGTYGNYIAYHAIVSPWLWFLTRTADCRIFQDKTVPDIIKEIFRGHGFSDFEEALSGSYRKWEYCVQYRETDFNFVNRLMEQEGIYYYFKHDNGKHTLMLADSISSHEPFSGYEQIPYFPPDTHRQREIEYIYDWNISQEVQPGVYTLNDFDFEKPRANLQVKSAKPRRHALAEMEIYDYPGEYLQTSEGETYARARIEELQARFEQVQGRTNARGLSVGSLFELTGYPRSDQNREFLISSASHHIVVDEYESLPSSGDNEVYSSNFTVLRSDQPYRPARITPKPIIQGPQTAVVVGPAGDEIHTDQYGRVKVRFHWDRESKGDEKSSCWIRVAQLWAGSKWGGIHIPRIGQEVIVEFLEGDPDRPIITGRVYNADNMPPYELPANATQSGIKSKSSAKGNPNNLNEIRFEDKKGDEQVFIHGEKDLDVRVKNTRKEYIGNERHLSVEKDQLAQVKKCKHQMVKEDYFEKVDGDVNLTVGGDRLAKLTGNDNLTVGKDLRIKTGTDSNIKSGGAHNHETAMNYSVKSGADILQKAGKNIAMEGGMEIHLKGGMKVVIEAGMQLSLKAGASFIDIGPAGISISGAPLVNINSGGAAGSGSGCSPNAPAPPDPPDPPKEPELPETAKAGAPSQVPPPPTAPSPQAMAFKSATVSGTPFCDT